MNRETRVVLSRHPFSGKKSHRANQYGSHPNSNHRIVRDPTPNPVGRVCSLFFILNTNRDDDDMLIFSMNVASGPELVAAVTNAGGLGVIGGLGYSPKMLREQVSVLATSLRRRNT